MPQYKIVADGVALVAATAKTVVMVVAPATRRAKLKGVSLGFRGVTSTDVPVKVEIVRSTQATAGTSSPQTPIAVDSADPAALCSGAKAFTAEPTVLTAIEEFSVTPTGGTVILQIPLGDEPNCPVSNGLGVRLTAPQAQTVDITLHFEE